MSSAAPWIRLAVLFPEHPKVVGLSLRARYLYVEALCYSGKHLTDGVVPRAAVDAMLAALPAPAGEPDPLEELERAGLWGIRSKSVKIHDYLEHNSSRAMVLEERAQSRERARRSRERNAARAAHVRRTFAEVRPLEVEVEVEVEEDRRSAPAGAREPAVAEPEPDRSPASPASSTPATDRLRAKGQTLTAELGPDTPVRDDVRTP